jgi:hypothetical protein
MNFSTWPAWLQHPTLWLTVLTGAVGALWALSEIVGEFRAETGRALRTSGAWLLVGVNFCAAALLFLLTIRFVPDVANWPSALLLGFAWPTFFRNITLKLAQPLNEPKDTEAAAIRFEQAYANIQKLSLQLINSVLTRQRTRVLSEVLKSDLDDLVKFTRRMVAISPQPVDPTLIDKTLERNVDEDAKKAYLAALVMDTFTRSALDDFIKERGKTRRT